LPENSTIYDMLSVGVREGTRGAGLPMFDYWAGGKHRKTVRRVRREVAMRKARIFAIDWSEMLPEEFTRFRMVDWHEPVPF
jgi:hypothetical protein